MKRIFLFGFFLLSACMKLSVESYSSIQSVEVISPVTVLAFDAEQAKELSWQSNARVLMGALQQHGVEVVTDISQAKAVVVVDFQVDNGSIVERSYAIPQYGVTGYSGASTYGTVYGNSYTANTTLHPTYGVTGYSSGSYTDVVYTHSFSIAVLEKERGDLLFEGVAVGHAGCGSFSQVAKQVIDEVLKDFPQGRVGTFEIAAPAGC